MRSDGRLNVSCGGNRWYWGDSAEVSPDFLNLDFLDNPFNKGEEENGMEERISKFQFQMK